MRKILQATHEGTLTIGKSSINCAVLEDLSRILTQKCFIKAVDPDSNGQANTIVGLPSFLNHKNLKPFIDNDLERALVPIVFKSLKGGGVPGCSLLGYKAELLPAVCKVFLKAKDKGVLKANQMPIANRCNIIAWDLLNVNIIDLIDEVTGYKQYKEKDALQKILEAYVLPEHLPWIKRFHDEFYEHIFRLKGWGKPSSVKRPQYVGILTNKIVYEKLPEGVLEELCRLNPVIDKKGHRQRKHHQHLTPSTGCEHLRSHLTAIMTLMRASKSWQQFEILLENAFPSTKAKQLSIPGLDLSVFSNDYIEPE